MSKRAAVRFVLALAGLVVCGTPGWAARVPWLYAVDMAVDGRTETARMAVSGAALAEVLSRVSGLAEVPRNDPVRAALARPEAYYDRFVFLNDSELRIHFVPAAVLKLADEAELPVWSANRPEVMAWLAVDSGAVRQVVGGDHALADALGERARQRGLVLKLPLMDLEDRMHVRPAVVWGRLYSTLSAASRRYGADVILTGWLQERSCAADSSPAADGDADPALAALLAEPSRAAPSPPAVEPSADRESLPDGEPSPGPAALAEAIAEICAPDVRAHYVGALEAWMNTEEFATEFAALEVEDAVRMAVDFMADALASRFAVPAREPNRLVLTIRGVNSPIGYGRLLSYLDGLEFVSAVDVAVVQGDRLKIALHTRADFGQLVELFHNDGRIRRDRADEAILTWQGP